MHGRIGYLQMWVYAFRVMKGLYCNTNNGTEAQNKLFKYTFLKLLRNITLSRLAEIIVDVFVPTTVDR